jgi:phosphoribosylaminoimidazolecarboxamide formyltransferase/IMP cyclohydrolase
MSSIQIKSALISVFHKDGLNEIINSLNNLGIEIYSTGGTQEFIESLGYRVNAIEDLTGYPSILDGRVKTLHPNVFGGILAKRNEDHLSQLDKYTIPTFDLVVVDLYPFEKTVATTSDESKIIEKIDIGGISLIRAAAKNFSYTVIIPSQNEYKDLQKILNEGKGTTTLQERKILAAKAFNVSSHYDSAIFNYFNSNVTEPIHVFKKSEDKFNILRYGENPHQKAIYFGEMEPMFDFISGKELSLNNLVDVDSAVALMKDFENAKPTFAIIKHTNACGVATRDTALEAWNAALAADNISAFGGIFITNTEVDYDTAAEVDKLFYEILIAPSYTDEALKILTEKKKRIILKIKHFNLSPKSYKSILNGIVEQDSDMSNAETEELKVVTTLHPTQNQIQDLIFANKCAKHLKSNTIVLVKNQQLIGMGCGQTSRIDACNQAIEKAKKFGFDLQDAVMASDAFFPFPDCVEVAHKAGIRAVIQPGGSIKDQLSIDYCNENNLSMVITGVRHFKH